MTQRIVLEEERQAGYPVVKRTAIGQTFVGAVLKAESRDRMKRGDDGLMKPIEKSNGKHAQELVVHCLTLPGTNAPAGLGEDESIPEPGDIVRLILKGKAYGDWIEAKKGLPSGTVAVGDVVTQVTKTAQVYDAGGNASGPEINDQALVDQARIKGRSVGIYGPLTLRVPEANSEWQPKAVAAYNSLQEPIPAESLSSSATTPSAYDRELAAAADPLPPKPAAISQDAWNSMPEATKRAVAQTMGSVSASSEPPF
jgi:hypothetical protein